MNRYPRPRHRNSSTPLSRRHFLTKSGLMIGAMAFGSGGLSPWRAFSQSKNLPIKVGVLHSLTGTMASNGRSLVDAILMAIDEVNQKGGILGRLLHPIVRDGGSDPSLFAREAVQLIKEDQVQTIFGCWTSASRKAVLPVVEREDHLLWYPVQYEGYEQSSCIMYGGAAPNQQILPALEWGLKAFGKKVFLVGSDYIFPRTANRLIKAELSRHHGKLSGEFYQPLGRQNFRDTAQAIKNRQPNFIINTINGDSNQGFFQALAQAKVFSNSCPVISMSIAEDELQRIGPALTQGHFAAWNYFQSIDTPANHHFVSSFQQRYGQHRVIGDPIESAYVQVHLYAMAATKAGTTKPKAVRQATEGLIFDAPQGLIRVDPETSHTWKVARIGQIQENGQFRIMWSSQLPVKPNPFPTKL